MRKPNSLIGRRGLMLLAALMAILVGGQQISAQGTLKKPTTTKSDASKSNASKSSTTKSNATKSNATKSNASKSSTTKSNASKASTVKSSSSSSSSKSTSPAKSSNGANGHEYVDLGLSVLWATCNVGARTSTDIGDYFAWGETSPKYEYSYSTSDYYEVPHTTLRSNSVIDRNLNLTRSHDAVSANWGGAWRLPTNAEFDELLENCEWRWTIRNDVPGMRVIGPNGKEIFLPAGGFKFLDGEPLRPEWGEYWSATADETDKDSYRLHFDVDDDGFFKSCWSTTREEGHPVRGVMAKGDMSGGSSSYSGSSSSSGSSSYSGASSSKGGANSLNGHEYVDLGLSVKWATCNVGASSPSATGTFFSWGETNPKDNYEYGTARWKGKDRRDLRSAGVIDSNGNLLSSYDAATANWGAGWRMPSLDEANELMRRCTWTKGERNGVLGWTITGPSGKSIFMPIAGYMYEQEHNAPNSLGYYFTRTACEDESMHAYTINFESGGHEVKTDYFSYGFPIRAVTK